MSNDILLYVEDPGAANFAAELPASLAKQGWDVIFFADGFASSYLLQRGVKSSPVPDSISAQDLLMRERPRLVIVGTSENPDTFGFELVLASRRLGIMSVGVIDSVGNAEYRFRGRTDNPLQYAPDWLIVPDQWTKDVYVALTYPLKNIAVCGHPHYDRVFGIKKSLDEENKSELKKKLFPACTSDRQIVVFVSEISTGLNPDQYKKSSEYTLLGHGDRSERTAIVLQEFLDVVNTVQPKPYLVLRMHPKNTAEEMAPFLQDFDQLSQHEPALRVVYAADLVVGMTTMLLQEAAIMGKQTLSIVPRAIEACSLQTIRAGITACVTTRKELSCLLPNVLKDPKIITGDVIDSFFPSGSLCKTTEFIDDLLRGLQ